ncbi:dTDP-4-amino-4,6-dideoxygalactose transaminase [Halomonas sp. M4R1S46]|nr:dTDP-4-amino-4,6-dideoxygalactose transaminase [Halomonas sp. M4R1S46]
MTIQFNKPLYTGQEDAHILSVIHGGRLAGNGDYTRMCQEWFERRFGFTRALMTPSCTHALEMAALLIDVEAGDEIIMPSFTFSSTANSFALRGAKIVFVDIRQDTMNIDENLIEEAITEKTKAIVPVHYAGVSCEMDDIMDVADKHGIYVIEDAAQGMMASYKSKALGSIGHMGAYSFHETKNYTSGGEGGLLIINEESLIERAEILREKGTNRSQFMKGEVDKYSWCDVGSSFVLSEIQSAYLWGQLGQVEKINESRRQLWSLYANRLSKLEKEGMIFLPTVPQECSHNAHIFYIKTIDDSVANFLMQHLSNAGISAVSHYVPLHTASASRGISRFVGCHDYTTSESSKLIRLPMWYGMNEVDVDHISDMIVQYFEKNNDLRPITSMPVHE